LALGPPESSDDTSDLVNLREYIIGRRSFDQVTTIRDYDERVHFYKRAHRRIEKVREVSGRSSTVSLRDIRRH